MTKSLLFGDEARAKLLAGAGTVFNAVKVTHGPRGKNVAMESMYGGPRITNDGVSIAKEIELKDPFENIGAQVLRDVATKTNDAAGDGTTTAVVIAHEIVKEGLKRVAMGANAIMIRRGIEAAANDIVTELKKMAVKVAGKGDIINIASISAESKEIGKIIAETISRVGEDGVVTVESSHLSGIESTVTDGMQVDNGYLSPYFATDSARMEAEYRDVAVLVTDKKISMMQEMVPLLESLMATGKKELVIFAEDVEGEALSTFILNKLRGGLSVLAVKAPGFGEKKKEMLIDIATMTGATFIDSALGGTLADVGLNVLGRASKVTSTKDKTVIVGGAGAKAEVMKRVTFMKKQLSESESKYDKESLTQRIAKMTSGVAVVRVGASTETEMKYLKDKIEDAVNATKSAIEEGIVGGGGSALVTASYSLEKGKSAKGFSEFTVGYKILLKAARAPFLQIAENSGREDGQSLMNSVRLEGGGFDFSSEESGEIINDMVVAGIIDPVKVTRTAVQNAASAASVLLTTDVIIVTDKEVQKPSDY
jgi:chaperonin GroEL